MLLLAGGTGLAPILSMLRTLRDDVSRRKAHLIYGVSTDEDLVELDQIDRDRLHANGFHLGPLRVRSATRAAEHRATSRA